MKPPDSLHTLVPLQRSSNRLALQARIESLDALRYTPAGLSALDVGLVHASEQREAGMIRQVTMDLRAVVIGELAPQVLAMGVGAQAAFGGFLTARRNGRGLVFHVTDFTPLGHAGTPDSF